MSEDDYLDDRDAAEQEEMYRYDQKMKVVAKLNEMARIDDEEAAVLASVRLMADRVARCEASASAYRRAARLVEKEL